MSMLLLLINPRLGEGLQATHKPSLLLYNNNNNNNNTLALVRVCRPSISWLSPSGSGRSLPSATAGPGRPRFTQ